MKPKIKAQFNPKMRLDWTTGYHEQKLYFEWIKITGLHSELEKKRSDRVFSINLEYSSVSIFIVE